MGLDPVTLENEMGDRAQVCIKNGDSKVYPYYYAIARSPRGHAKADLVWNAVMGWILPGGEWGPSKLSEKEATRRAAAFKDVRLGWDAWAVPSEEF